MALIPTNSFNTTIAIYKHTVPGYDVPYGNLADGCTVGRDSRRSTIHLFSPVIPLLTSRLHCRFTYRISAQHEFFVRDLGSVNGTYLNGRIIPQNEDVKLEANAEVSFGGPRNVYREGVRLRNDLVYTFLPLIGDTDFMRKRSKIHWFFVRRCIPKLLAWRRRATERVFSPSNMEVFTDDDGESNMRVKKKPRLMECSP